ncbi:MAG: caspase family protein [Bacteroidota bacterium]
MKKHIFIGCLLLFPLLTFGQFTDRITKFVKIKGNQKYDDRKTLPVNILDVEKIEIETQHEVNERLKAWMEKGATEDPDLFVQRISSSNRERKARLWTQEKINAYGLVMVQLDVVDYIYDARNKVFKLDVAGVKPIYIKVPNQTGEADVLIDQLENLRLHKPQFTLTADNQFALLYVEIFNPQNGQTYIYDSETEIKFQEEIIRVEAEPYNITDLIASPTKQDLERDGVFIIEKEVFGVDENIPDNGIKDKNTYALIIGNEDYTSSQTGLNVEQNVAYAERDATTFREYCIKTLGVPQDNIILRINEGYVGMKKAVNKLKQLAANKEGQASLIVYYAGHGLPDDNTKEPYLIPVDGGGTDLNESAIKLEWLYTSLAEVPTQRTLIFLDACFSGGARQQSLSNVTRKVKIPQKTSVSEYQGNMVVFAASSGTQSALSAKESLHGLFTYHLLKKLKETRGKIPLGELSKYLSQEVNEEAIKTYEQNQRPEVQVSNNILAEWKTWTLMAQP